MSDFRSQRPRGGGRYEGRRWGARTQKDNDAAEERGANVANWRRGGRASGGNARAKESPPPEVDPRRGLGLGAEAVRGECVTMCSKAEVRTRVETRELSRFETPPSSGSVAGSWAVKKYRRPAAGRVEIDTKELRPPPVLAATLQHLFNNVLPWEGCGFDWPSPDESEPRASTPHDFLSLYHFMSDCLRSVRQDFVVQRVCDVSRVAALMQIARFYVLASFRATQLLDFSDRTLDWSETLNDQQLASALTEIHAQFQSIETKASAIQGHQLRQEAVALDVLLHLRDPHSVSVLLLKVPPAVLHAEPVKRVLGLFVAFHSNHFWSFMGAYRQLPILQQCLALRHLPVIWTTTVTMMNKAYGKIDRFGLNVIADWTGQPSDEEARLLCTAMNIHMEDETSPASSVGATDGTTLENSSDACLATTSVAKFKVHPIREGLDDAVARKLVRRKAVSIQAEVAKSFTSTSWVLSIK